MLELFFQFDEEDIIAPYDDLAIICKHIRAVELFGICEDEVHVGVNVVHPALVLDLTFESHSDFSVNCTLQCR
jgi:hypothetical protein